tara:strand:- start:350 stop:469 length:120 start_codon:yes stop_codon:yes gene_type:complete
MKCKNCRKEVEENTEQLCYDCFCDKIDIQIEKFVDETLR